MLIAILEYCAHSAKKFFKENRFAKAITVLGFFVALGFLISLVYALFYFGFKHIAQDEFFGDAVMLYIVELFLLVSFLLVFASALLSGVFVLFRSSEDEFIVASPSFAVRLPIALSRMIASSLWPLVVIIFPALTAFHQVFGLSLLGSVMALSSSVLLLVLATLLAVLLLIGIAHLLLALHTFSFMGIVTTTMSVFVLVLSLVFARFASLDLVQFFQARLLEKTVPDIGPILDQFLMFPSHLSALTIYFGSHGDLSVAFSSLCYLLFAVLAALIVFELASERYLVLWQRSREGSVGAQGIMGGRRGITGTLMHDVRTGKSAILCKEIIAFLRNGRGLLWLSFIVFIWVIQSASSHLMVRGLAEERVATISLSGATGMLQFAVSIYFVAMFALRFAFPSFSAERRSFWVVASSPAEKSEVFMAKLVFFTALFVILETAFTLVNAFQVGLALPLGIPLLFAVTLGTFFVTTLALTLGAIFPNHETDDPERLSTTLPGLVFIVSSLLYGALGAYAVERYVDAGAPILLGLFSVVSCVGIYLLVKAAYRALGRVEYA